MKFSLPAAAALDGAAQAQTETGANRPGIAFAADLATLTPLLLPDDAPLQRRCFRSALMAPRHHARGGDAVGSLN
jgi:hypothetical protein